MKEMNNYNTDIDCFCLRFEKNDQTIAAGMLKKLSKNIIKNIKKNIFFICLFKSINLI